jgi:hypothetical protein
MLKSKGAMIGVAVALVGAALLAAGMAVTTTSGAGTDGFHGAPTSGFPDVTGPAPAAPTDPAIPGSDPSSPGTPASIPGTDPAGDAGAGGTEPSGLPSAGFGVTDGGNGVSAMLVLLAMAGAALVAAGATAVTGRRG